MSEWWTYRPSSFLLFAPQTYYRLIEAFNREVWPAQLIALVAVLLLVAIARRGTNAARRVVALALAAAWALVAWRFLWLHYSAINWAAPWFAAAFGLQAALLIGSAVRGHRELPAPRTQRYAGLLVVVLALALQPLIALSAGRAWPQLEVAGLLPDPTAIVTLGLLLITWRRPWLLLVVPILWCVGSALTLWNLHAPDAVVPAAAAALALGTVLRRATRDAPAA